MKKSIIYNEIVRETEKAMLVSCPVSYNDNAPKAREIWMPKSVIGTIGEKLIDVEDWFITKLSEANAFHGYRMNFEF